MRRKSKYKSKRRADFEKHTANKKLLIKGMRVPMEINKEHWKGKFVNASKVTELRISSVESFNTLFGSGNNPKVQSILMIAKRSGK